MSAEHGSVQPGGLRREHIVAAVMVAAVTIVLGYASGFGVRDANAAVGLPANPGGPVAAQPGGQPGTPPLAGPLPAGPPRPIGSPVGLRPGVPGMPVAHGFGSDSGFGSGFDAGSFPIFPSGSAGDPAAPPAGPAPSAPQCPPGILDPLLALLTQVLGGNTPAQALSDSGAVVPAPAQSGTEALVPDAAGDVPVLLPVGDGTVLVVGLIPLLDAVSQWEVAHRQEAQQQTAQQQGAHPGGALSPVAPQPAAAPVVETPTAAPGDQLSQLAALLAPVGLYADPGTGIVDPLLAPVLGSLGCGGIVPATPLGAVQ